MSRTRGVDPQPLLVALLFFLSGATALTTEIVLGRLLGYVFGSSHLSVSTVLAATMGGMALGAMAAGRLTVGMKRPLRTYGVLELCVGLYLAALPTTFGLFQRLALAATSPWAERPAALTGLRFVMAFGFVLAPMVLMGGTLPVLVRSFGDGALRVRLPLLYGTNTLGAATGTLVGAYLIIPVIGLDGACWTCALVDLLIALGAFALQEWPSAPRPEEGLPSSDAPSLVPWAVCTFAFAQGVLTFGLEVVWTHLIGSVVSVTVYGFAVMLSAILLGIGLGSLALPRVSTRLQLRPLTAFIAAELLVAMGVVGSLYAWDRFPHVIAFTRSIQPEWSFAAREIVRVAFTFVLLSPTTFGMGLALPALAASIAPDRVRGREGYWVGLVYGSNTVGNIAGALGCGFALLGRVASERILMGGALVAFALALAAIPLDGALGSRRRAVAAAACAALGALALGLFPGWDPRRLTCGSNYFWTIEASARRNIIFFREDAQSGFVTVERLRSGIRAMKTNGKYEGSSERGEFQDNFGLVAGLYLKRFDRAALIGLGPGRTLQLLYDMPFRRIEMIEYSPAVIEAAQAAFPEFTGALRDRDRVRLVCDDGRNHLQLTQARYDYIGVGITAAAFAGAGRLYTKEFFETMRDRLAPGGIAMLWLQMHHVLPEDVIAVASTFHTVFPCVHLYADARGRQGYLLASRQPLTIDTRTTRLLSESPVIRRALDDAGWGSLEDLTAMYALGEPSDWAALLRTEEGGMPDVLSDFRPLFEYRTPYGLALDIRGLDLRSVLSSNLPRFDPPLRPAREAKMRQDRRSYVARSWQGDPGPRLRYSGPGE